MFNFSDAFATGKLKNVPLNEIEEAISAALSNLVGEADQTQKLSVHITSLEFESWMAAGAKMTLNLSSHYNREEGEKTTAAIVTA